ncbi:MAG: cytochrome b/b6 [Proteobacteria bacterium]|nr:cytochrome b/b6 [Pseudomonadota bacterium]
MAKHKYTGIMGWIEDRLPIFSLIDNAVGTGYHTPKNLNYWWNFGSLAGFALVIQIVTGIILAMHYNPSAAGAFESIEHIMRDVNYGWLMRYVHSNGGSLFFLVVFIHVFRGLYYGSFKAPRELLWMLGLVILLLMMMTAFTGYVLPWGQMSFWAATVITEFFSAIPGVGTDVVEWLRGSFAVDNATLNRFYSFHYLLPFLIVGIVIVHIWALHVHGSGNPKGINVKKGTSDTIPFHPFYTIKDLFGMGVFIVIFAVLVFYYPNLMSHPDNYIPANPGVTPPHIVPEWYFLPFYAILRAVTWEHLIPNAKLWGVIAMAGSIMILFVIPWIDKSKVRSMTFRPLSRIFFWIMVADVFLLGVVGAMPVDGIWIYLGQFGTAYYFLHFTVILYLLGKYEKTRPLPKSISEPVIGFRP